MFHGRRKYLGLAATEHGITAVEAASAAGRIAVLHSAELAFTELLNLDNPEALGRELRSGLRSSGIRSTHCTIGLAANWIAAREKVLPIADAEAVRGAMSIAAEREFASGHDELLFDYVVSAGETETSALLLAARRSVVDQLLAAAKAAGLSVDAVTSSTATLALAAKSAVPREGRLILCLLPHGVEAALQTPHGIGLVRHLSAPQNPPDPAALADELRRVLLTAAPAWQTAAPEVLVWNAANAPQAAIDSLARSLGTSVNAASIGRDLGLADAPAGSQGDALCQAAALVAAKPQIDFIHSRLAAPVANGRSRRIRWTIAASAVAAAGLLWLVGSVIAGQFSLSSLRRESKNLDPPAGEARTVSGNITYARGWYDQRPEMLRCMQEITQAFPEEGKIWATTLTIREAPPPPSGRSGTVQAAAPRELQILLTGKARDEKDVTDVFDRLKANKKLTDIKMGPSQRGEGTSQDVTFSISANLRREP